MAKTKTKPFDTNLTDAEFKSRIVSALRQLTRYWRPMQECIKNARVWRNQYKCEGCWKIWPAKLPALPWKKRARKNIVADHIREIVPVTWFTNYNNWIERAFVWVEWFQALCYECHTNWKTKKENEERRAIKKWIEVWRKIDEFPEKEYYVSNEWRVKWPIKILKLQDDWYWYNIVTIWHSIKRKVHRLVAQAFIWDIEWMLVCHKDDNPLNNNANNLFIWTYKDNMDDKVSKWRHILWWKSVSQYTLSWKFIKEWKWWAWEIKRELWFNDTWVYNCCNWKFSTSKWFKWEFTTKEDNTERRAIKKASKEC